MKIYAVGGAVRDELLGLPVRERDWVVVGATPEEMLAQGFRPVGRDFPVFLHPKTHEEYALARTERKTAPGYTGFVFHAAPSVTLSEDLARRDLTINAMARDDAGELTDLYGGQADLAAKVLRHVSGAFSEDPVRILRMARFAARFSGFVVAAETMTLMRGMVDNGEVDALVPERVWQEFARGLMEAKPTRMFDILRECGALEKLLPGIQVDPLINQVLPILPVRFATLVRHQSESEIRQWATRLPIPVDCKAVALLSVRFCKDLLQGDLLTPDARLSVLEGCDALRRPERFGLVLETCATEKGEELPWRWKQSLALIRSVDAGSIAKHCADPGMIPMCVRKARIAALQSE
ncbi:MAG: multifunctional CCA tRNA nucleotidyl transferase/2'3'-cyclic phosphodiesterase/2'nucleotidase/phosphatase [Rhodocyclaceae bacterium]|nr:multifunctional CCA tRNA nucleotidyl transferase/2'3'-cyclic phosphodiesterase/2'nucleotidase/phosphatase [Rhodocyclaceae bacterium]